MIFTDRVKKEIAKKGHFFHLLIQYVNMCNIDSVCKLIKLVSQKSPVIFLKIMWHSWYLFDKYVWHLNYFYKSPIWQICILMLSNNFVPDSLIICLLFHCLTYILKSTINFFLLKNELEVEIAHLFSKELENSLKYFLSHHIQFRLVRL